MKKPGLLTALFILIFMPLCAHSVTKNEVNHFNKSIALGMPHFFDESNRMDNMIVTDTGQSTYRLTMHVSFLRDYVALPPQSGANSTCAKELKVIQTYLDPNIQKLIVMITYTPIGSEDLYRSAVCYK